tara:strand:- start:223 stop:555 length:333 start_codon:yes stop_codon:yes gene_type:complete
LRSTILFSKDNLFLYTLKYVRAAAGAHAGSRLPATKTEYWYSESKGERGNGVCTVRRAFECGKIQKFHSDNGVGGSAIFGSESTSHGDARGEHKEFALLQAVQVQLKRDV